MMSTISDTSSAAGNETCSSGSAEPHTRVNYAIPYVELKNTSSLLPPEAARRLGGKRIILPCYAAMESDFLANCLQGLSGLPGCESALLGSPWYATTHAHAHDAGNHPSDDSQVHDHLAPTTTTTTAALTTTTTDDAHKLAGASAVTDLARADFFRPPPAPFASASPRPETADTAVAQSRTAAAAVASGESSPAMVPRPPLTPPTAPVAGRPLLGCPSGVGRAVDGVSTMAPVQATDALMAPMASPGGAMLRGGIRSQWESTTAQTEASLLYNAFVRQNRLDSAASLMADDAVNKRELMRAAALHVDISAVTAAAMDSAEESETRSGQTNVLTAMFMPVLVPSSRPALASGASHTTNTDACVVIKLKEEEEEEDGGSNSRSEENTPVREVTTELQTAIGHGRSDADAARRHSGASDAAAFACFASNAVPRMPSYEFPQIADDVLVDIADFMVRRSTADRNVCTTSTRLSLCEALGNPMQYREEVSGPQERNAAYQRGLQLMMAASFLLL